MSENRIEISPHEFAEQFLEKDALLVSMDANGKPNVMALAWKTLGELWHLPIISVAVAPSRYTFELMTEGNQEFTVNIPSDKTNHAIMGTGSSSGRHSDKFKENDLETIPGKKIKVPTIKDCLLSYECRTVHSCTSGKMASHHVFFGEILTAHASKELKK